MSLSSVYVTGPRITVRGQSPAIALEQFDKTYTLHFATLHPGEVNEYPAVRYSLNALLPYLYGGSATVTVIIYKKEK